jgi:pimeloyl-ACP methyl ester carboxylesterase
MTLKRQLTASSKMVDCENAKLHLQLTGKGNVCVVFEAGLGCGAETWCAVRGKLENIAKVFAYDRAGLMHSDERRELANATDFAYDLKELLDREGIEGPHVLVGHSLGGCYIRIFANLFPEKVAALVFIDALHSDYLDNERLKLKAKKIFKLTIAASGFIKKSPKIARVFYQIFSPFIERYLQRKYAVYTRKFGDEVINAVLSDPIRNLAAVGDELILLDDLLSKANEKTDYGDIPVTVIANGKGFMNKDFGFGSNEMVTELNVLHKSLQLKLLTLSSSAKFIEAEQSGHVIPLDEPELVANEIDQIIKRLQT